MRVGSIEITLYPSDVALTKTLRCFSKDLLLCSTEELKSYTVLERHECESGGLYKTPFQQKTKHLDAFWPLKRIF